MILRLEVEPGDTLSDCEQVARMTVLTTRPMVMGPQPKFPSLKIEFVHDGTKYRCAYEDGKLGLKALPEGPSK